MAKTITINGVTVTYKPGFNISDYYNEQLDGANLLLPQVLIQDIEPMDHVIITETDVNDTVIYTKNMVVAKIHRETVKHSAPKRYNYQLALTSPTIRLERIILPNRSITQPLAGTKSTILTKITQYLSLYAPDLTVDSVLTAKTTGIVAPELSWQRPNLKEVLNDLLVKVHCVVTMVDFTHVSCIDLDAVGSPITSAEILNEELDQNIEEYASEVEMDASNVITQQKNASTLDYVAVKTTTDSTLTTNNAEIIVDKPIYSIQNLFMICPVVASDYTVSLRGFDITDHVIEKKVYNLKIGSKSVGFINPGTAYKRNYIYYTEGSNVISGLTYKDSTWFVGASSWEAILTTIIDQLASGESLAHSDVVRLSFLVNYTTIDGLKFTSEKQVSLRHESTLINNQDSSYCDGDLLAKKQQQTVNRLGNPTLRIYGRYASITDAPALGDTFDTDYILTSRSVSHYENSVEFTGELTKDYVRKVMFTGLNSRKRYTQFADVSSSFTSNHLNKKRMQFSFANSNNLLAVENYFLQIGESLPVKLSVIKTYWHVGATLTPSSPIGLAGSASLVNRNIIYNVSMQDNISAGSQIVPAFSILGAVALGLNMVPYVDSNGEFEYYDITLYTGFSNPNIVSADETTYEAGLTTARQFPIVDPSMCSGPVFKSQEIYRYKDNREITSETYQFIVSSVDGIYIADRYFDEHPMIYKGTAKTLHCVYSLATAYTGTETTGLGLSGDTKFTISVSANHITLTPIEDNLVDETDIVSWGIVDASNNLYIGVNGSALTIYLNAQENIDNLTGTASTTALTSTTAVSGARQYNFDGSTSVSVTATVEVQGAVQFTYTGYCEPLAVVSTTEVTGAVSEFGGAITDEETVTITLTGYTVWPTTASPTISDVLYDNVDHLYWRITNNDSATVTIMCEIGDSTPDAITFTLASGASHNLNDGTIVPSDLPVTIYCTAQAFGKKISATVNETYDE